MDVTQRLIVGLLVLSILFSFVSIAISYSASQIKLPGQSQKISGNTFQGENGGLNLYIEKAVQSPNGGE